MLTRLVFILCLCSSAIFAAQTEIVYVMTVPKSGTHLAMKLMNLLRTEGRLQIKHRFVHYYMSDRDHRGIDMLAKPELKKMTLIRDLRDVAVSLVYFLDKLGPGQRFLKNQEDNDYYYGLTNFADKLTFVLTPNNSYSNFVIKNCEGCVMALQNPNILVIRFEDLVGAKGGGSDEIQKETIYTVVDFIGDSLTEEGFTKVQQALFGNTRTFRKGQIGSWKEEFTSEHIRLFEQMLGKFNRELGYW